MLLKTTHHLLHILANPQYMAPLIVARVDAASAFAIAGTLLVKKLLHHVLRRQGAHDGGTRTPPAAAATKFS